MKVIETEYRGYLFRSRLEARWAVYFDALGINWEYEVDGYTLDNGVWYLPDFYLPSFDGGMYVEVKPYDLSYEEMEKCRWLCSGSGKEVWLAIGVPSVSAYRYLEVVWGTDGVVQERVGIPKFSKAIREDRMYVDPEYDFEKSLSIPKNLVEEHLVRAAKAAKQARFEHLNN